jgi:hypothetical protein
VVISRGEKAAGPVLYTQRCNVAQLEVGGCSAEKNRISKS